MDRLFRILDEDRTRVEQVKALALHVLLRFLARRRRHHRDVASGSSRLAKPSRE
jgi:hypothetical protein